jgi:hypothetical protein
MAAVIGSPAYVNASAERMVIESLQRLTRLERGSKIALSQRGCQQYCAEDLAFLSVTEQSRLIRSQQV